MQRRRFDVRNASPNAISWPAICAARIRLANATGFGNPVDPDVKPMRQMSSGCQS
jgi:hypothetical protein